MKYSKPITLFIGMFSAAILMIYIFCMLIYPWFSGGWYNVQKTWAYWQSLNAAVIAFISSLIILYAARYQVIEQRKRDFQAAKSFLPHVLNDMSEHIDICAGIFKEEYKGGNKNVLADGGSPILTMESLKALSECIKYSDDTLAAFLTKLLCIMQINNSRINSLCKRKAGMNRQFLLSSLNYLCLIKSMVDKLYEYTRDDVKSLNADITEDEMYNSLLALGIIVNDASEMSKITGRTTVKNT
ncbi:hypothetical protein ACJW8B_16320 [Plesiomonas shigelloides]|uniref:hypothetical protein n=1 Tax=Plesiomonas shigelloides TaxID=703 RepID=UPI00387F19EF